MEEKYRKEKTKLGYLTVTPKPSQDELNEFYAKKYYQESVSTSYAQEYTQEEKDWFYGDAKILEYMWAQKGGKATGRFYDVGCGEGFFADYFLRRNWQVSCCDFSNFGVKSQNPAVLEYLEQGDIYQILENKLAKGGEKFDLINLANVLEHVLEPEKLLQNLKAILHKDGILRIGVPNDFSPFQNFLVESNLAHEWWFSPPEHLNYFNFENIRPFVTAAGYKIERMLASFPIDLFIVNKNSNYWKDRSLGKEAHHSRVRIDNFLHSQGIEKFVDFYEACARAGIGRDVIAFISPS